MKIAQKINFDRQKLIENGPITIVAFGTSLPELITFFESQKHYKKAKNNIFKMNGQ